jgi:hypothetical protein
VNNAGNAVIAVTAGNGACSQHPISAPKGEGLSAPLS